MKFVGAITGFLFLISLFGCNSSQPFSGASDFSTATGGTAAGTGGSSYTPVSGSVSGTAGGGESQSGSGAVANPGGGAVANSGSGAVANPGGGGGSIPPAGGTSGIDSGTRPPDTGVVPTPADAGPDGSGAGGSVVATGGTGVVAVPDAGPVVTSKDPVIPPVNGECPNFVSGAFNFMGLSGLMDVGPKGSGGGSLVFHWHGTAMAASWIMMGTTGPQKIKSQGGIIISPDGPAAGEGGDVMCSGTAIFGATKTFTIVDQIVACAVRDYAIDPHRIYAIGCSAGGLQSGCMGALRSNYVAAVTPNSGGVIMAGLQNPAHAPAVMTMHGAAAVDCVGVCFADTSRSLDTMMKNAGAFVVNCDHGGIHCGAPGDLLDAAIDFMLAHPFGVEPEPYASGLPANFPSSCKVF